ncbi:MAG TPA: class I SAM-dependent methyltransferase [Bacteroidota bacterium]
MSGTFRYRWFQEALAASVRWQIRDGSNSFPAHFASGLLRELRSDEIALLAEVEAQRRRYEEDFTRIEIHDSGSGNRFGNRRPAGTIASIAKDSAISARWGLVLYHIVTLLKPRTVLELGTNLGISAGYILAGLKSNGDEGRLVSVEGDPTLAAKAAEQADRFARGRCRVIPGRFQDVLPLLIREMKAIDFVFIDGHHTYDATLANFECIRPALSQNACVLLDDIATSGGVRRAWKHIRKAMPGAVSLHLIRMGLLMVAKPDSTKA